jgi:hypothetical protein
LLGLVSSLIAMVIASFVQKRDELSLKKYEGMGLLVITSSRNGNRPTTALTVDLVEETRKNGVRLNEYVITLQESINLFATQINKATSTLDNSAQHFRSAIESQTRLIEEQQGAITNQFDASLKKAEHLMRKGAAGLTEGIASFSAKIASYANNGSDLFKKMDSVIGNMESQVNANLGNLQESCAKAAEVLTDLVPGQQVTLQAIGSINTMNQLLKELQEGQRKILPVLTKLTSPMELKLVPARHKTNEGGQ